MTTQQENYVTWDAAKRERLRTAYKEAVKESHDSVNDVFTFEDNIYVISYAKYLIEYLDTVIPK